MTKVQKLREPEERWTASPGQRRGQLWAAPSGLQNSSEVRAWLWGRWRGQAPGATAVAFMPISEPHIFPFLNFKIQLTKKFKIIIACKNHHKEHRNIPFLILLLNSRRGNQWAPTVLLLLDSTCTSTNQEWPCAPRAPGNIKVNFVNAKGELELFSY
jgi:hypothetical protein